MQPLVRTIELEFSILEFYKDYVIATTKEGAVLVKKQINDLVEVCSDFYEKEPFVYLSRRINNYNVDPTIYVGLGGDIKNLAGIGIISQHVSSTNMANFEKKFCKIPFEIFDSVEEAVEWTHDLLKNKKADL